MQGKEGQWLTEQRAVCQHLLTCSSMKGWATRSNLSSMGLGKAALTNLAASFPKRMASTACMRRHG